MTLDEILALLPDNDTGEITAADLRTVVTEVWNRASLFGQSYSYQWSGSGTPNSGRIGTDLDWDSATKVLISETTNDGETLTFTLVDDDPAAAKIWLATATGARLHCDITGPSVDQGSYRELPVQVIDSSGTAPGNNEKVTVALFRSMP